MQKLKHMVIVLLTILTCVGCDQATKATAKFYLPHSQAISYADDLFRFQYTENTGAFMSIGAHLPAHLRELIFTLGASLIVAVTLGLLLYKSTLTNRTTIGLSLICGGGIGNLIDRIFYKGHVVDFLNIGIGSFRTGIFNIADVTITVGTILLFIAAREHEQTIGIKQRHS